MVGTGSLRVLRRAALRRGPPRAAAAPCPLPSSVRPLCAATPCLCSNPLEGSLLVDMTQAEERVVRGRHEAAAMWHYLAQVRWRGPCSACVVPLLRRQRRRQGFQGTQACPCAPAHPSRYLLAQLAGGDLAALSREVQGVPDPDISRAAGGGLQQDEAEEADGTAAPGAGGLGSGGDPSQAHHAQQARWQQQRRRTRLADSDYRDGAGI